MTPKGNSSSTQATSPASIAPTGPATSPSPYASVGASGPQLQDVYYTPGQSAAANPFVNPDYVIEGAQAGQTAPQRSVGLSPAQAQQKSQSVMDIVLGKKQTESPYATV